MAAHERGCGQKRHLTFYWRVPLFKGFNTRISFRLDTTDYTLENQETRRSRGGDVTDRIQNVLDFVRQSLDAAQVSIAEQANKQRRDIILTVGEMVFLSHKNYSTERPSQHLDNKKWGPLKVPGLIDSSYRLELGPLSSLQDPELGKQRLNSQPLQAF